MRVLLSPTATVCRCLCLCCRCWTCVGGEVLLCFAAMWMMCACCCFCYLSVFHIVLLLLPRAAVVVLSRCRLSCVVQIRKSSHSKEETLNVKPASQKCASFIVLLASMCIVLDALCDEIGDSQTFNDSESTDAYCTRMRTDVRMPDRMSPLLFSRCLSSSHSLAFERTDNQLFWQCSTKQWRSGFVWLLLFWFSSGAKADICCMIQVHFPKKESDTRIFC